MSGIVVVCLLSVACVFLARAEHDCPFGAYFDSITQRCDSCSQLCQHALVQGTVDDCRYNCPDYGKELLLSWPTRVQCPRGQYYDQVLSHCDHCGTICDDHETQSTTETCKEKCPTEFWNGQKTIRKNVLPDEADAPANTGLIAGISILLVATLLSVALSILYRHKITQGLQGRIPCLRQQYTMTVPSTAHSNEEVRLPVEESQDEGFPDLRSSRIYSWTNTNTL